MNNIFLKLCAVCHVEHFYIYMHITIMKKEFKTRKMKAHNMIKNKIET